MIKGKRIYNIIDIGGLRILKQKRLYQVSILSRQYGRGQRPVKNKGRRGWWVHNRTLIIKNLDESEFMLAA